MTGDPTGLFEHAPAAYVVLDRDGGRIREANGAFLALVGRSREDVLGRGLSSMWSVAGRIFHDTHLMPTLELSGRIDEVALEIVTAGGARIPVLLNANLDRSGEHAGEAAVVRVVLFPARHRRLYETELLRATREAEEARSRAVELARSLQQTLIPPVPPVIPRLQMSAVYRPAGAGDEVGGDFYDVFNVAPREWVVVLGDVSGKGIPAATVTAYIRHTVRDLAMQHADPADLLHELDAGLHQQDTDKFCTVVVLRLSESDRGWRVTGSSGGHPLPLLGHRDGTVVELGSPGSLIGILDDARFTTFTHDLADDEFVTVYTDGVTEARRGGGALLGDETLQRLVSRVAADPASVSDAIVAAALAYQDDVAVDDIAVLTLHPTRG
ncbi:PP2C family protein-serine/threonine phosphatase [Nocardioides sp.]|uniref:PP2C family protein-serine/threonine phosphatase n=1 Tax=Nocardioides sp. TaxID=35761 RepID=UPI0027236ABD|nr:SpoIIE family protein phosphatase [Nocardioides sp.]MDO9457680.1 SpoIIE family protein phosphatase [Nocardioides sp.]